MPPPPIQVNYLLRTHAALGVLSRLAGPLFGRPCGSNLSPAQFAENGDVIGSVVVKEAGLSELPVITQLDFKRTDPMFVLPYGVRAMIDADARQFSIIEATAQKSTACPAHRIDRIYGTLLTVGGYIQLDFWWKSHRHAS